MKSIFLLIIIQFCNISYNAQNNDSLNNDKIKYKEEFDEIVLKNEHLEYLSNFDSIISWLKRDSRWVFLYDNKKEITTSKSVEYINTIKKLKNNYYLVQDFYSTGEIVKSTIYRTYIDTFIPNIKFNNSYENAKIYGKSIRWNKVGLIAYVDYHVYTDWEKYHHYNMLLDISDFQIEIGTNYKIINKTDLLVKELYNSNDKKIDFYLPESGIKGIYAPELNFIFGDNFMKINDDNVTKSKNNKVKGLFSSVYNSNNQTTGNYDRYCSLGHLKINYTSQYCIDANYHSLLLELDDTELFIQGLFNIELFITDSNGDGMEEIYLFSFINCNNTLKLIKIGT